MGEGGACDSSTARGFVLWRRGDETEIHFQMEINDDGEAFLCQTHRNIKESDAGGLWSQMRALVTEVFAHSGIFYFFLEYIM